MSDNSRGIVPGDQGWLREFIMRLKLLARLMADKRVNPFLKLIPVASLVYLVVPFDFAPIIPLDDMAVLGLGMYLFIEFCPPEVVEEHMELLHRLPKSSASNSVANQVIEAEFNEVAPAQLFDEQTAKDQQTTEK
jgi:uncharacterized membrane protein YkvA (DUF1232 family)